MNILHNFKLNTEAANYTIHYRFWKSDILICLIEQNMDEIAFRNKVICSKRDRK